MESSQLFWLVNEEDSQILNSNKDFSSDSFSLKTSNHLTAYLIIHNLSLPKPIIPQDLESLA